MGMVCGVCGTEQVLIGEGEVSILGNIVKMPIYNIDFMTHIGGKWICEDCMNKYNKIYALHHEMDFSCGGIEYYADGRNLN